MSVEEIIKLPFEIQLVLAAGYIAYRIAATGLNRAHNTTDVVFQVLVYGLVAFLAYNQTIQMVPIGVAMATAIIASIIAASIWRRFGRQIFVTVIRGVGVTRENYSPSTWDHLIQSHHKWAYFAVTRDDDVVFESNLQTLPSGLPFEPLDIDMDGNVAIYVTRRISSDDKIVDYGIEGAVDTYGRAHLTYIPASRIKTVTVSLGANVISSTEAEAEESLKKTTSQD